jgi:hypothetical protein
MSEQGVQALLERARMDVDFRATLEGAHTRDDRRKIVKDRRLVRRGASTDPGPPCQRSVVRSGRRRGC